VEHPKDIGDRSTLAIIVALRARGYGVLVPFGENTRYDLVTDDGVNLARVQCKTGRLRDGVIVFATASTYGHHRNARVIRRTYGGEIDFFAVFCPETDGVYLVPIKEVPTVSSARLRVEPARNWQARRVRHAAEYEVGRVSIALAGDRESRYELARLPPALRQDLTFLLVVQDLPLDPLERVVDRLRVAAELLGHLLVGRAFEVEPERVRLE
jgi:hypothetical protein